MFIETKNIEFSFLQNPDLNMKPSRLARSHFHFSWAVYISAGSKTEPIRTRVLYTPITCNETIAIYTRFTTNRKCMFHYSKLPNSEYLVPRRFVPTSTSFPPRSRGHQPLTHWWFPLFIRMYKIYVPLIYTHFGTRTTYSLWIFVKLNHGSMYDACVYVVCSSDFRQMVPNLINCNKLRDQMLFLCVCQMCMWFSAHHALCFMLVRLFLHVLYSNCGSLKGLFIHINVLLIKINRGIE